MQSRSDQIKAQSALHTRMTCALVTADPDELEHPTRRPIVGSIAGLLIGCLVLVGFAIYGYFVPGGSSAWQQAQVLTSNVRPVPVTCISAASCARYSTTPRPGSSWARR